MRKDENKKIDAINVTLTPEQIVDEINLQLYVGYDLTDSPTESAKRVFNVLRKYNLASSEEFDAVYDAFFEDAEE